MMLLALTNGRAALDRHAAPPCWAMLSLRVFSQMDAVELNTYIPPPSKTVATLRVNELWLTWAGLA